MPWWCDILELGCMCTLNACIDFRGRLGVETTITLLNDENMKTWKMMKTFWIKYFPFIENGGYFVGGHVWKEVFIGQQGNCEFFFASLTNTSTLVRLLLKEFITSYNTVQCRQFWMHALISWIAWEWESSECKVQLDYLKIHDDENILLL